MAYTTIDDPGLYFKTVKYTSNNGSSPRTISGVGFQPDWVWVKNRDSSDFNHVASDSVRGLNNILQPDSKIAQLTNHAAGSITSANSDGFVITAGSSNRNFIRFESNNTFTFRSVADSFHLNTNRMFKDPSAWIHVVLIIDTTQGTAANRIKIYVNGVQETDFATETYPDQNADHPLFAASASNNHFIGRHNTDSQYLNGYLGEFVKIDGTAEAQTSFGEFDTDSPSIWKPIDPSGLTFGNNGYYLDFEDSSALGADVSGNSNSFTVNNFDATKAHSTDNCSYNLATLNPIKV